MHAQQKRERLGGTHLEDEWDHQGESRRAADARQQADTEAEAHADKHQAEGFPLQNKKETVDECVEHWFRYFISAACDDASLKSVTAYTDKIRANILDDKMPRQGTRPWTWHFVIPSRYRKSPRLNSSHA